MNTGHYVVHCEGAPVLVLDTVDQVQDFILARPGDAELIDVWKVPGADGLWSPARITADFALDWSKQFDYADGPFPLSSFPPFVLAHCRPVLLTRYYAQRDAAWLPNPIRLRAAA